MGVALPALSAAAFAARLTAIAATMAPLDRPAEADAGRASTPSGVRQGANGETSRREPSPPLSTVLSTVLSTGALTALYAHYCVLRRWNARLSLVGPGTVNEVLARHYGESLAGLSLIEPGPATVVDVGSGAGFPGFVLAAARPDLSVVLVEARQRKWSFLRTAIRHAEQALKAAGERSAPLSCTALNVRIARPLPPGFPDRFDLVTSRAVHLTEDLLGAFLERRPTVKFLLWRGSDPGDSPAGLQVRDQKVVVGTRHRRIILAQAKG